MQEMWKCGAGGRQLLQQLRREGNGTSLPKLWKTTAGGFCILYLLRGENCDGTGRAVSSTARNHSAGNHGGAFYQSRCLPGAGTACGSSE